MTQLFNVDNLLEKLFERTITDDELDILEDYIKRRKKVINLTFGLTIDTDVLADTDIDLYYEYLVDFLLFKARNMDRVYKFITQQPKDVNVFITYEKVKDFIGTQFFDITSNEYERLIKYAAKILKI